METHNPFGIAPPFGRYSHGVEIPPGKRLVRTSGQLAVAPDGSTPDGVRAQADLIFANIAAILDSAGMDAHNVCHLSAYVTDRADMPGYMAARDEFLKWVEALPSSTLMIVSGFTRPEFVVEIEAWAAGDP
ncbi:MAG: RidA family protein [Pseudomonadota bacterium]